MLSEAARTSRIAHLDFDSDLPNLNPLDYYVWSVVERVKSRHPNMTSLRTVVEATFVGMNSVTLQRACEHFRPSIEAFKLMGDISNNCAL